MKKSILKAILTSSALLVVAGYSMLAQAHCIDAQTLTTNSTHARQYDVYVLSCPAGSDHLFAGVSRTAGTGAGNAGLNLEIGKDESAAAVFDNSTNAAHTCATANTGFATTSLAKGAGQYTVVVSKDTTSNNTYSLLFHCEDAAGNEIDVPYGVFPGGLFGNDIDRIMNH